MLTKLSDLDPGISIMYASFMDLSRAERLRLMRCFFQHNELTYTILLKCQGHRKNIRVAALRAVLAGGKRNEDVSEIRLGKVYCNLRYVPAILNQLWESPEIRKHFGNKVDSERNLRFGVCPMQDTAGMCSCWVERIEEQSSPKIPTIPDAPDQDSLQLSSNHHSIESTQKLEKQRCAYKKARTHFQDAKDHSRAAEACRQAGMAAWARAMGFDKQNKGGASQSQTAGRASSDLVAGDQSLINGHIDQNPTDYSGSNQAAHFNGTDPTTGGECFEFNTNLVSLVDQTTDFNNIAPTAVDGVFDFAPEPVSIVNQAVVHDSNVTVNFHYDSSDFGLFGNHENIYEQPVFSNPEEPVYNHDNFNPSQSSSSYHH